MRVATLLLISILILTAGCVEAPEAGNQTQYETVDPDIVPDTSISTPTFYPAESFDSDRVPFTMTFSENVILKSFKLDGKDHGVNTTDHMTFSFIKELSVGNHTVEATVTDVAGNEQAFSHTFLIDTSMPALVKIEPSDYQTISTNEADVRIVFNEEVTIISAMLDNSVLNLGTTDGKEFTIHLGTDDLDFGTEYKIRVTVEDAAGNQLSIATSFSTKDIYAPVAISNLEVTDTGDGGILYITWDECDDPDFERYDIYRDDNEFSSVDGKTKIGGTMPADHNEFTVTDLTDGKNYCFIVVAVDDAGNYNHHATAVCEKPSSIDKKPPLILEEYPDTTWTNSSSPEIKVVTNEKATCKLSFDTKGGWDTQEYAKMNYTMSRDGDKLIHTTSLSLDNGNHQVFVLCKDEASNIMTDPESWTVTVDFTP